MTTSSVALLVLLALTAAIPPAPDDRNQNEAAARRVARSEDPRPIMPARSSDDGVEPMRRPDQLEPDATRDDSVSIERGAPAAAEFDRLSAIADEFGCDIVDLPRPEHPLFLCEIYRQWAWIDRGVDAPSVVSLDAEQTRTR